MQILKGQNHLSTAIKWKDAKWTPCGLCCRRVPSGDKATELWSGSFHFMKNPFETCGKFST